LLWPRPATLLGFKIFYKSIDQPSMAIYHLILIR